MNTKINECRECLHTAGGRAFTNMLEAAVEEWTADLIETNDKDESVRIVGAIRSVKYLLKRVHEDEIEEK